MESISFEKNINCNSIFYPEEFKINEVALEFTKKGYYVDILTNNPTYPHGEVFKNYKTSYFQKKLFKELLFIE